jgi:hypothetical protein
MECLDGEASEDKSGDYSVSSRGGNPIFGSQATGGCQAQVVVKQKVMAHSDHDAGERLPPGTNDTVPKMRKLGDSGKMNA